MEEPQPLPELEEAATYLRGKGFDFELSYCPETSPECWVCEIKVAGSVLHGTGSTAFGAATATETLACQLRAKTNETLSRLGICAR